MVANKQDSNDKMVKFTEEFKTMLAAITDQINTLKSLSNQNDSPNLLDPTTVVPDNRRAPTLDGVQSTKIGGMWTLKRDISSPIPYELLVKIELKGDTAMDLKNSYNHINMCRNSVTILLEDLIPGCQSINRNSDFAEYFTLDRYHPSYSWNVHIYTSLVHSLVV